MRRFAALLLATSLAMTAPHASGNDASSQRLLVGKTNIYCIKAPCPWRGIVAADTDNAETGPAGLLWSGQELPPLEASPENTDRIVSGWNAGRCLVVDGRLVAERLTVETIVGDCP